jgi:hypothetical protein
VFNSQQIRSPENNEWKLQHTVNFDFQVITGKSLLHYCKFISHLTILNDLNLDRDLHIATKCLKYFSTDLSNHFSHEVVLLNPI